MTPLSENATLDVMTSDVDSSVTTGGGRFFPPSVSVSPAVPVAPVAPRQQQPTMAQRVAGVSGLSRAELRVADAAAMSATLQGLWDAMKNQPVEEPTGGEMHPDGTPRISSQVAVWMIGQISRAYGCQTLVRLSAVTDIEVLRSLGGLTRLLIGVIDADTKRTAA